EAVVLLKDMAQRMNTTGGAATAYVADDIGATDPGACPANPVASRDLCEWANLIRGAAVQQGGSKVGAVEAARGCISALGGDRYLLSIVWQGVQGTAPSALACGKNGYTDEKLRRGASVVLQFANLSAP